MRCAWDEFLRWHHGRKDGRSDRRSDGRTDGRTDGRSDKLTALFVEMPPRILKTLMKKMYESDKFRLAVFPDRNFLGKE